MDRDDDRVGSGRFDVWALADAGEWRAGWNIDVAPSVLDLIHDRVSLVEAIAMSELMWPRFVEVRGCVVRADVDPQDVDIWLDQTGSIPETEGMVNHVHLGYLFDSDDRLARPAMEALAGIVSASWRSALRDSFPGRRFVVDTWKDDDGAGLSFHSSPEETE